MVEGSPPTKIQFFKGLTQLNDGGRFRIMTDGETNTISLGIRKTKPNDEGMYKVIVTNEHGKDQAEMELFISDASGMDFRDLLKKKKYAKWKKEKEEIKSDLKEAPPPKPQLKKVERKQEQWLRPLADITVKEKKDKKVVLEAEFSRKDSKARWYHKQDELFNDSRHKIEVVDCLHTLTITNPKQDDCGRFTVESMGATTSCILTVEEADPDFKFVKPLPKKTAAYTYSSIELEATVNSHKAIVHWYKGEEKIEDSEKYEMYKDMTGLVRLTIKNSKKDDKGKYKAVIFQRPDVFSETTLKIEEQPFKFTKQLTSMNVIENSKVILECEVNDPKARVTWYIGDQKIEPDANSA